MYSNITEYFICGVMRQKQLMRNDAIDLLIEFYEAKTRPTESNKHNLKEIDSNLTLTSESVSPAISTIPEK